MFHQSMAGLLRASRRSFGRRNIPVHEITVDLPFSRGLSLPNYNPLPGIENTAVGRGCRKIAGLIRQISTLLYLSDYRAKRVTPRPNNLFPSLMDCVSTLKNWCAGDKKFCIVRIHSVSY